MKKSKSAENFIAFTIPRGLQLLSGEVCKAKQLVTHTCIYTGDKTGELFLTNYRLYFQAIGHEKSLLSQNLDVPLGFICKIKFNSSKSQKHFILDISCKDMRKFRFEIEKDPSVEVFLERIKTFTFPLNHDIKLFSFSYSDMFPVNGWKIYDPIAEYHRMGIVALNPKIKWRISNANQNFELCDTYPAVLAVPGIKDKELQPIASFRSRNRLPVLSWIHPINLCTIVRCSQPLNGVAGNRCTEDERYLNVIRLSSSRCSNLTIVDARPLKNAIANKAKGGGYESKNAYANTDIFFLNIENIHAMRESHRRLKEICLSPSSDKWLTSLENTMWLKHIKDILTGSILVVDRINEGSSVVVHCSDGWDRTSQITSLAMLMLDGYYRTIKGFEVLIEKEWLSFGHKFQQRYGHGDMNCSDEDRSPIFIQFIDCVFQIMNQYPTAMEFNEHFLMTILDNLFTCRFGTFLCNNERERSKILQETISLWSWMNSSLDIYLNPSYNMTSSVLKPTASMRYIIFWKKCYFQCNPSLAKPRSETTQTQFKKRLEKIFDDSLAIFNEHKMSQQCSILNLRKLKKPS